MDFPSGKGFDRKLFLIFTNLGFDFTHSEPLCISYAKIVFMHLLNMGVIDNSMFESSIFENLLPNERGQLAERFSFS